ncbi:tripartite tricarboxylate transporter substrate binding protein [Hydrogenophaga palleronii]|uniref:tripartite tricarboxylate transporter substrate binding protein n=1 Tax=Hydrogenophaga palleronii TaxID=65655 RepID=UPI0008262C89|nr:tripartite tricarboxylate transporter substrate binding protein [Hydrogenophaga palleronii]
MTSSARTPSSSSDLAGRRRLLAALAASPLSLALPSAFAQNAKGLGDKPLRLIVPFPAGGGVDLFARPLAPALSEVLGVPVLVENIGGAAGRIGTQRVAQAARDGHTLLLTNDTLVASDAVAGADTLLPQLKPVTLGISSCNLFVTHPKSGITDPASYLHQLKAQNGQLTIGVPGWGTAHHLTSAALNHQLGVSAGYVPYRGGAPLIQDLLNGTLSAGVVTLAAAVAHIQAGTLVGIAVTSKTRAPALPKVPTLDESIAPGFLHKTWQGILAPAGTPDAITAQLHAAIVQAIKSPRVQEVLPSQGFDTEGLPGADFAPLLASSLRNFQTVVKATHIQAAQG